MMDVLDEYYDLTQAAKRHDPAATADAAVKMADAVDKAVADRKVQDFYAADARREASHLRSYSETVRKATEAPNVEARQSDLDKARAEQTDAHQKVRPARDAYRKCLDNLG
ncbi:hypothetical protein [Streptomyces sp. NPDC058955]|uniref:hypothetical protein n=2 Tax=unclassified Streptomyces TaxID=2593676 RepID=UPI0036B83ECB